jgi:hypothetical protein
MVIAGDRLVSGFMMQRPSRLTLLRACYGTATELQNDL